MLRVRSLVWTLAAVAGLSAIAVLVVFYMSFRHAARDWALRRDVLAMAAASRTSLELEMFRREHSRYPATVSESEGLRVALGYLRDACRKLGHPLGEVRLVSEGQEYHEAGESEVLVAQSASGEPLVVIYEGGGIALNRVLLTRPLDAVPEWIELIP